MRRFLWLLPVIAVGVGVPILSACSRSDVGITDSAIEKADLVATGRNVYFILEPGYYQVLEGDGAELTIVVLGETRTVDGVETRVVLERETRGGELIDASRSYFAVNKRTNDVFHFGQDVDMYIDHAAMRRRGVWLSGVEGARFGLMMPGQVSRHARYAVENAPGVAMDRAQIVSTNETVTTPAGEFRNCVKVKETSPLEPLVTEFKYYAPGIGMVQHGNLKLVRYGKASPHRRLLNI